jgi:hypothetical protein
MRSLHKSFEVVITDSAHVAEASTCHFIHQTRLINAPTKHTHYNTYNPTRITIHTILYTPYTAPMSHNFCRLETESIKTSTH